MRTSYKEIIMTEEYKQLEMSQLVQYLSDVREHGRCSEDLLHGVLQWTKHAAQTRSTYMAELFTVAHIGKCNEQFILKMMDDNAELLSEEQNTYKAILSDVLKAPKPAQLGHCKSVLVIGGQSASDTPNTRAWILKDNRIVKFHETDEEIQRYHSICQLPCGALMLTGGENSDLCMVFILSMKLWVKQQDLLSYRSFHGSAYSCGRVFLISGVTDQSGMPGPSVDFMNLEDEDLVQWSRSARCRTCTKSHYI